MAKVTGFTERERIEFVLRDWMFWGSTLYPKLHLSRATRFAVGVPRSVLTDVPGKPGDVGHAGSCRSRGG